MKYEKPKETHTHMAAKTENTACFVFRCFSLIQPDMFGIFGNFGILIRNQEFSETERSLASRAWTADRRADPCGFWRLNSSQAGSFFSAGEKKDLTTIKQVLFLGKFRCMNNAKVQAKDLVHASGSDSDDICGEE